MIRKQDAHDDFPKLLLIHAACLIRQTVQSLKIRKEANNHIGETGTSKCLTFLMEKTILINFQSTD